MCAAALLAAAPGAAQDDGGAPITPATGSAEAAPGESGPPAPTPAPVGLSSEPDPAYEQLVRNGIEAQAADDFARAHEAFASAQALYPNARALRAMGIASFKAGLFVRAIAELEAALAHTERPLDDRLRRGVLDLVAQARNELSEVTLAVTPAASQVFVDDDPSAHPTGQPLVLVPGPHTLRIEAPGRQSQTLGIEALRGARQQLRAELAPLGVSSPQNVVIKARSEPVPRFSAHRLRVVGVWSTAGLSVASGLAAVAVYATARYRMNQSADLCRKKGGCDDTQRDELARSAELPRLTHALNSTLFLAVGSLALGLGLASWDYLASGRRIDLSLSLDRIMLRGRF